MELVIYSPQENQFIKEISFNFEDIKQEMTVRLAKYQDLVYTEDTIKEAKTDRATLNKFKEAIENKRKEVKKQCLAPYEEFEKKIKELTSLIDAPILAIDGQVKAYEQQQKIDKKAEIFDYYYEHIGTLATLLPFDRVFNEKWLNATVKTKEAFQQIDNVIEKTTADLGVIDNLKSEFALQVKDTYLRTLDLSAALNEKTRLEEQKARLEAYEANNKKETAAPEIQTPEPQVQESETVEPVVNEPVVLQIDFRVWATKQQLEALKGFLKSNNIKYGRVE